MKQAKLDQLLPNKALHPTAYSFGFGRKLPSPALSAAGELGRCVAARSFQFFCILEYSGR